MGRSTGRERRGWLKAAPWLYFAALTLLMTWPLAQHAGDHILGNRGDNFYFLWLIRWWEGAVQRLPASPFVVPGLNYPEGWNLAYNEIPLTMVAQALPVSALFGTTAGFNFSVWMSFLLSGMGMFYLVRRLTGNGPAALVAGTVFAFAPYRYGHLMGHFNLVGTQWLPFYFLALHAALENAARKKPFGRWLAGSAACLGLIGLTSQYYLYMSIVLTAAFVAGFWIWGAGPEARRRASFYLRLAGAAALLGVVAVACALPYFSLSDRAPIPPRSGGEMAFWSSSVAEFFIPPPYHFLLRGWVGRHFDRRLWVEKNLYLGLLPLALGLLAFAVRKKAAEDRRKIALFGFMFACAFVLALGPRLKITPGPTDPAADASLNSRRLPLPGALLVRTLPYYDRMRAFSRYGVYAILYLAVLVGFGVRWIVGRTKSPKAAAALTAFLALFVLFEFKEARLPMVKVEGRPVDRWLAERHDPGAVVQFPASQMVAPDEVYNATVHKKPFVGAFFAAFPSPQWSRIFPVLERFPDGASVALLRELNVRYVLVDSTAYSDFSRVQAEVGRLALSFLTRQGPIFVYQIIR
ncbi:MAG: hypothetical protein FJY80_13990 [Candidatus Aminicenantes bacterium]|nr:hypothetical protein [Candidatus Aminicenantes bacterium]